MMWAMLFGLLAQPSEPTSIEPTEIEPTDMKKHREQQAPMSQSPEPNMELLLFLAEWDEAGHEQGIDPASFATDDAINMQLDHEPSDHHENNHPDHH